MAKNLRRTISFVLALMVVLAMLPMGLAEAASMKKGSKGTEVKYLQQNLIGLGYLQGDADGSFGSKTEAAVRAFQTEYGLSVDGSAGNATQTALRNAVVRLQAELKLLGYAPGSADGHFGSKTAQAVRNFQSQWGMSTNGIAGTAVRSAIDDSVGGMRGGVTIRKGSGGTQVKYLQQALIGLGFLSGSADGKYGSATEEAVRKYQKAYGLSADGSAGPDTMTSIRGTVVALQSDLMRKGWYSGSIDGVFGSGTKSAVRAYQSHVGVAVTGVAGPKTMEKLYGYAMGGNDSNEDKSYKVWIDPLFQNGDFTKIYYDYVKKEYKTIDSSGCAGVAMAMAVNALLETNRHTPAKVMEWYIDHNYYYGHGTEHEGVLKYPRAQGLNSTYCSKSSELIAHLKKGRLAVVLIKDITGEALFTYRGGGGHYIVVSGYREKDGVDQIFVNNPLSYKSSRWFDLTDLTRNWIHRSDLQPCVIIYK